MFIDLKIIILFVSLILTFRANGVELVRLDKPEVVDVRLSNFVAHLYITENCSVCSNQIKVLESCLTREKVVAYMDGNSEEKLRNYIKRKKIPFKTFYLTSEAKVKLGFGKLSPSLTFSFGDELKNVIGLKDCNQINTIIRSGNLTLNK